MRLKGQQKGGFYPAPPTAIQAVMNHISFTTQGVHLLDPCAGEGEALMQLARHYNAKPYAIELEEGRGEKLKLSVPDALAPCSMFGVRVQGYFDMLWLNPPYDDEMGGGGRVEQRSLQECAPWLRPGGLLALVVPEHIIGAHGPTARYLRERFDDVRFLPFPHFCRKFREVIVLGYKRDRIRDLSEGPERWNVKQPEPFDREDICYYVKGASGPRTFEKCSLTDDEIARALYKSPLQRLLKPPKPMPLPRPPLPVAKGHLAMLLASGHMDGLVLPEDGSEPHVVRGTAIKQSYLKEESVDEKPDGSTTTRQVYAEKICLTIRVLTPDGKFRNLTQE